MRLILVGETNPGSRTPQRLRALTELGHRTCMISATPPGWSYESKPGLIDRIRYRLRIPADKAGTNAALSKCAAAGWDAAIFDNARSIEPGVLRRLKAENPEIRLIWYSEDDTMNPIHRTRCLEKCIPLFDLWVTTKSFNTRAEEVPSLGAKRVLFVDNSFCPHDHAPLIVGDEDRVRWGAGVGFVGTYEKERADDLIALAQAGVKIRVWGNNWNALMGAHPNLIIENRPVYGEDYRRVVAATDLNLCFLRKGNRDLQTCRSVELPAMGAAMLHESSVEVERMFFPDREAVYFADRSDLINAVKRWSADPDGAAQLRLNARERALKDGHDHLTRWNSILEASCAS